jgi:hypothetical protein
MILCPCVYFGVCARDVKNREKRITGGHACSGLRVGAKAMSLTWIKEVFDTSVYLRRIIDHADCLGKETTLHCRGQKPGRLYMPRILLIFPVLSYLFMAAHELRADNIWLMAGWLVMAVLILVWRRPWVRHLSAMTLMLGLFIWGGVTVELLQFRMAVDAPYALLLTIMGSVGIVMAVSIAITLSQTMRDWFACRR